MSCVCCRSEDVSTTFPNMLISDETGRAGGITEPSSGRASARYVISFMLTLEMDSLKSRGIAVVESSSELTEKDTRPL